MWVVNALTTHGVVGVKVHDLDSTHVNSHKLCMRMSSAMSRLMHGTFISLLLNKIYNPGVRFVCMLDKQRAWGFAAVLA